MDIREHLDNELRSGHTGLGDDTRGVLASGCALRSRHFVTIQAETERDTQAMTSELGKRWNQYGGLVEALELAIKYVAKGDEKGAYEGCMFSGARVVKVLEAALRGDIESVPLDWAVSPLETSKAEAAQRKPCQRCDGDGRLQCIECDGDIDPNCGACYGAGSLECSACRGSGAPEDQQGTSTEDENILVARLGGPDPHGAIRNLDGETCCGVCGGLYGRCGCSA